MTNELILAASCVASGIAGAAVAYAFGCRSRRHLTRQVANCGGHYRDLSMKYDQLRAQLPQRGKGGRFVSKGER